MSTINQARNLDSGPSQPPSLEMRSKLAVALVCGVALLLVALGVVYAWDRSQSGKIADGVRVGSLELGGHTEQSATEFLRGKLVKPPILSPRAGAETRMSEAIWTS